MVSQGNTLLLMLCAFIGVLGLLIMTINVAVGAAMVLIPSGIVTAIAVQKHKANGAGAPARIIPQQHTIDSSASMQSFINPDPRGLGVLMNALKQAGLNPDAAVLISGDGDHEHTETTVKDILVEMLAIAQEEGQTVAALEKDIVKIYPRVFENVYGAVKQYTDLQLIKIYIARKAMIDVQMDPSHAQNL